MKKTTTAPAMPAAHPRSSSGPVTETTAPAASGRMAQSLSRPLPPRPAPEKPEDYLAVILEPGPLRRLRAHAAALGCEPGVLAAQLLSVHCLPAPLKMTYTPEGRAV